MSRWMPGLFLLLLGTDEAIKQYVEDNMDQKEERKIPGGKLLLRKVYNPGFALGAWKDDPKMVKTVSAIAGIWVFVHWVYLMWKRGHWIEKIGSTLTAAGAAGNLFDRLWRGQVVDYIGFRTTSPFFSKLTANLADLYLAVGTIMMTVRKIL